MREARGHAKETDTLAAAGDGHDLGHERSRGSGKHRHADALDDAQPQERPDVFRPDHEQQGARKDDERDLHHAKAVAMVAPAPHQRTDEERDDVEAANNDAHVPRFSADFVDVVGQDGEEVEEAAEEAERAKQGQGVVQVPKRGARSGAHVQPTCIAKWWTIP